ncbi:MAG: family 16 glycosylhydrolase [Roseateles sp.]|uniref:family 16 glycosylhydrolase n=1 Tax=Roseateles sp. TaxID=1971397 RepID=UPI0039E9F2C9
MTPIRPAIAAALLLAAAAAPAAGFFDDFDGTGGAGPAWETATWHNGPPFGCGFAYSEVWKDAGRMVLNVNAGTGRCGEIRTVQKFTYGKFTVRLKASDFAGGNTSFFLYTGDAGTASHHEIDIELIKGGTVLHTNVWKAGVQHYRQFPIAAGWQTLGFEWREDSVRWFAVDAQGGETTLRRQAIAVSTPMQLMLNHWRGDDGADALSFLGRWSGGGGPAYYDWVKVE